ncbi:helix-turn-helix domain-containing protein [Streptomyces sp. P1-3]|uniref:helix-turn-helix domain-containing protein n=1 Tax=Streptomyces sp. P1-3 TaxID=3421658 RepID=UPI003D35D09E
MRTHGTEVRRQALTLLRSGGKSSDVARALGLPPGTVRSWLHLDRAKRGMLPGSPERLCPRCDGRALDEAAYAYLLGLYLGDGHIMHYHKHRVPSLSIACSNTWPGLIDRASAAVRAVLPDNKACRVRSTGCTYVKVYSKHLSCLFPQHGAGKKHERPIALEPWQQRLVDIHPWEFVRGLIHSDGSRITNWTTRVIGGERKRYEYPRYFFTNASEDITRLFTDTLDKLGVEWKPTRQSRKAQNISVARRASVALMDAHIGPKY